MSKREPRQSTKKQHSGYATTTRNRACYCCRCTPLSCKGNSSVRACAFFEEGRTLQLVKRQLHRRPLPPFPRPLRPLPQRSAHDLSQGHCSPGTKPPPPCHPSLRTRTSKPPGSTCSCSAGDPGRPPSSTTTPTRAAGSRCVPVGLGLVRPTSAGFWGDHFSSWRFLF